MTDLLPALVGLQIGLLNSPLGKLLGVIVAIGIVILVGRIVLSIAWRLVTVAAVAVAILLLLSLFLPGL